MYIWSSPVKRGAPTWRGVVFISPNVPQDVIFNQRQEQLTIISLVGCSHPPQNGLVMSPHFLSSVSKVQRVPKLKMNCPRDTGTLVLYF